MTGQNKAHESRLISLEECMHGNGKDGIITKIGKIQTDLDWLKKGYWLVATASIGTLLTILFAN